MAVSIGKAWSGSWLGYHSRVYYEGLEELLPGARFSQEWGIEDRYDIDETVGNWREYRFDDVVNTILKLEGNPDLTKQQEQSKNAREYFDEAQSIVLSILSSFIATTSKDKFIQDLLGKAENEKLLKDTDFVAALRPSSSVMSRDSVAIEKGLLTPPHLSVLIRVNSI
ncbi:hypothetical protein ES707_15163 [subsurface metagenome]